MFHSLLFCHFSLSFTNLIGRSKTLWALSGAHYQQLGEYLSAVCTREWAQTWGGLQTVQLANQPVEVVTEQSTVRSVSPDQRSCAVETETNNFSTQQRAHVIHAVCVQRSYPAAHKGGWRSLSRTLQPPRPQIQRSGQQCCKHSGGRCTPAQWLSFPGKRSASTITQFCSCCCCETLYSFII